MVMVKHLDGTFILLSVYFKNELFAMITSITCNYFLYLLDYVTNMEKFMLLAISAHNTKMYARICYRYKLYLFYQNQDTNLNIDYKHTSILFEIIGFIRFKK